MVCLVSISFAGPPRASQTLTKGRHQWEFGLGRFSSMATSCTAQKVLGFCSSNKLTLPVNQSCQHHLMTRPKFLSGTSSHNFVVNHCTEIVISGYWVGPDIDDGWGFVEAVVNQMI